MLPKQGKDSLHQNAWEHLQQSQCQDKIMTLMEFDFGVPSLYVQSFNKYLLIASI